jgi:serine/threonine protein kinase
VAAMDERVGSAELEHLAESLATPCRLGDYVLEGLICKTSTALVFVARGGAFGADEGVMKVTGNEYARLLKRELRLLNWCQEAEIDGIVRPVQSELEWMGVEGNRPQSAAAILLPFLGGGDLVQWIGAHANHGGHLGPHLALEVGGHVGGVLRNLLQLPKPLVHRDVKLQNVLLPYPGAPLNELTLIDLDVSEELDIRLEDFASAPADVAERLVADVRGFGELLFDLATGRDPPIDGEPNPRTGNPHFDSLVEHCLTSQPDGRGYTCLADDVLWRDIEKAVEVEEATRQRAEKWESSLFRLVLSRWSIAGVGMLLFVGLVVAVMSKVSLV